MLPALAKSKTPEKAEAEVDLAKVIKISKTIKLLLLLSAFQREKNYFKEKILLKQKT